MKATEFQRSWKSPEFRDKRLKKAIEYQNRKYKEDPRFSIHKRMTTGVNASLNGGKKGRRWESLVGYSVNDLMFHLERQFLPGMSWQNRSEWHIDHIRPISMFRFETFNDREFKEAWELSNLRPLWGPENQRKWAARTYLI